MGKLKSKVLEVKELYENGYDSDDIPLMTDLTQDNVNKILQNLGFRDEEFSSNNSGRYFED